MRYLAAAPFLAAGVILLMGFGLSPQAARAADAKTAARAKATADPNAWRYVRFQDRWWYWLPEDRWVYWQNNRWNDFGSPTTGRDASGAASRGVVGAQQPVYAGSAASSDEVRPFYGHALSDIYRGPSSAEDIGPFYGHALPHEVLGNGEVPRYRRGPYYGHAGSSTMY
jgi:hypothetical protein